MTIGGWFGFGFFAVFILCVGIIGAYLIENIPGKIISVVAAILLILGLFFLIDKLFPITMPYLPSTKKYRVFSEDFLVDPKNGDYDTVAYLYILTPSLGNGLERTVTIYTADGEIIAQYTGKIDIEGNDGGYVLFDYEGKRYTYYNCFVESIAEIGP